MEISTTNAAMQKKNNKKIYSCQYLLRLTGNISMVNDIMGLVIVSKEMNQFIEIMKILLAFNSLW